MVTFGNYDKLKVGLPDIPYLLGKSQNDRVNDLTFDFSESIMIGDELQKSNNGASIAKANGWNNTTFDPIIKNLRIRSYNWEKIKDTDDAISKAQDHLIGLIRYFEGDPENNYKAKQKHIDRSGTPTYGYGVINKGLITKPVKEGGLGMKLPKTEEGAYHVMLKYFELIAMDDVKKTIGLQKYDSMPDSMQQAFLDFAFRNGRPVISKRLTEFKNAIDEKNWPDMLKQMVYPYDKNKKESAGLHKRALARVILGAKDLLEDSKIDNKTKDSIKAVIKEIYDGAISYANEKEKSAVNEINQVYNAYCKRYGVKIEEENATKSAEQADDKSFTIPEGKGYWAAVLHFYPNATNKQELVDKYLKKYGPAKKGMKVYPLEGYPIEATSSSKPSPAKPEEKQVIAKPSEQEAISVKQDNDNFYVIKTGEGYLAAVKALFPKVTEYKQQKALADLYEKELGTAQEGMVLSYSYSMADDLEDFYISDEYKGKGVFAVAGKIKENYPNLSISQGDLTRYIGNYNKDVQFQVGKTLKVPRFEIVPLKIDEESGKLSNHQEELEEKYPSKSDLYKKLGDPIKKEPVKCKYSNISLETYSYEVGKSEGYWGIANKFGIAQKTLINSNGGKATPLDLGQKIKIPRLVYTLQKGESIEDIAKKLGVSVSMLKHMNDTEDASKELKKGFKLAIPGYLHKVQSGENLTKIAKNADVSVQKLEEINNLSSDKIMPNQKLLILYNDVNYDIPKRNISETKPVENVTPSVSEIERDTEKASIPTEDGGWKTVSVSKLPVEENVVGKNRPYFRIRQTGAGQILATREVFTPDKKYQNGPLAGKTIIVNAGHGYKSNGDFDDGTTEDAVITELNRKNKKIKDKKKKYPIPKKDGLPNEAQINYDNAMRLKDHLLKQGARVIYLQGGVWEVADEIPKPENKADMFISIHIDSQIFDLKVSRSIVIFPKEEQCFGQRVQDKGKMNLYSAENNSIREQGYKKSRQFAYLFDRSLDNGNDKASQDKELNELVTQVARNQGIPSLLWEVDFITSQAGRDAITDPKEMGRRCNLVCDSVVNYFQEPEYLFDIIGEHDSIDKIAKRNGCTQKKILDLNPHLFKNIHGEPTPKQLVRIK